MLWRNRLVAHNDKPHREGHSLGGTHQVGDPFVPVGCRDVQDRHVLLLQEVMEHGEGGQHMLRAQYDGGPTYQRGEKLFRRHIKAERGKLQDPIIGVQAIGLYHGQAMVDQRTVFDHHAFGFPGRAGGVDNVSQVGGRYGNLRGGGRVRGYVAPLVQIDDNLVIAAHRRAPPTNQQHRCGGIFQQKSQPLLGVRGVKRHIGPAGFEDAQDAHHHSDRPVYAQPHQRFGPHPQAAQVVGQLVRPRIQLAVGDVLPLRYKRHRLRGAFGLCRDQVVNRLIGGVWNGGCIPFHQNIVALCFGE